MGEEYREAKSIFNAGMALAERIDSLQRAMNASRFNPLAYNGEVGKFNYEIMQSCQDSLLAECWGKLSPSERIEGERIKKLMSKYLEQNSIISRVNSEIKINKQNYKRFLELIDIYEKMNKIFYEAHDLNSPNKEQEDDDEL